MIHPYKIDSDDKSYGQAYKEKVLEKFYHRTITRRSLKLTREECEVQFSGKNDFVHLNSHTFFSIMSGVDNANDLFKAAKDLNLSALAVTETGYMSSIPDCYSAAGDTKLKFMPGICAWFSDYEPVRRKMDADDPKSLKDHPALIKACQRYRTPLITLIAKNEKGYKDLLNLNAESWKDGFYYVPKINRAMLEKYAGDIVVMSGTLLEQFVDFGFISGDIDFPEYGALSAYGYLEWMMKTFGDDFYVEVVMRCQDTQWGSDLDRLITISTLINSYKMANGKEPKLVITNDVRYVNRKDEYLYKAMAAIARNTTLKKITDYSSELYLKTRAELRATYKTCLYDRALTLEQFEKACDMTLEINDKCSAFKANTKPKLPEVANADAILREKVAKALMDRGLYKIKTKYEVDSKQVTYVEQAQIELSRFIDKGFSSYFLIMQDLIQRSHSLNWQTGPARGSAGGSLVCFLLGIISMDPLKFGLSFDRFLSPSRGGNMLKITME